MATTPPGTFDANSPFRQKWMMATLLATGFSITIIPYRISFMDGFLNEPSAERLVMHWFALEAVLVDMPFVVDFVLQRRLFAFMDNGEQVTDPAAITAHYWLHGSYMLDLMALIPFELLLLVAAPLLGPAPRPRTPNDWPLFHSPSGGFVNWHTIAFLKVNRFVRVLHFHSLSDQLQQFLLYEAKLPGLRPGQLYLWRLGLDFMLGTHWLACIFFGVSYLHYQDGDTSWLTTPGMLTFEGCADLAAIRRVPFSLAYLRSFHFSIGAITTVCYGDILPMNAVENAATLAVIFVSVVLFSVLSGGFFKFFAMEFGQRAAFEERVTHVGHFMAFHGFPPDMWTQMKVYFALSWQESKGMHEDEQLRGLPTSVRQDIALYVHANLLQHVRLFRDCDEQFSRSLIAAIKHEFFVRNDVIIQRGDMERSLYIIESGRVVITAVLRAPGSAKVRRGSAAASLRAARGNQHPTKPPNADDDKPKTDRATSNRNSVNEWITVDGRNHPDVSGVGGGTAAIAACANVVGEREERIIKGPFDYFGERSLLFGTPRNATCVAACVSSLFVLTSDRFDAILEEFPSYRGLVVRAWVMTRHPPKERKTDAAK